MSDITLPESSASHPPYRGRFAPSPTGPLHFGSLVAAVASYAQALVNDGEWLVRIEDIDPTREIPGAGEAIIESLLAHGFRFPEPLWQSSRLARYDEIITALLDSGHAFRCSCSRRILKRRARPGRAGLLYPGTCRNGADESRRPAIAVRLRSAGMIVGFEDAFQGHMQCNIETDIGDFLLRRGDGFVAYQTAVATDDVEQKITEVVRGTDLLDSTFMQLAILQARGLEDPQYAHFPVVTGPDGRKLSKQSGATEINNKTPSFNILRALSFLLQEPPEHLKTAPVADIWAWVRENWDPSRFRGLRARPEKSMMVQ